MVQAVPDDTCGHKREVTIKKLRLLAPVLGAVAGVVPAVAQMAPALRHTGLTCAHYSAGDALGKVLAHASLAPVAMLLLQAGRVHARREVHEALVLCGLVLEEAVARCLKAMLRQPRPAGTCAALGLCSSHGMPSSHASLAAAAATLMLLRATMLWPLRRCFSRTVSAVETAVVVAAAAAAAVSRVYLGYHSWAQVAAGVVLGCVFGCLWHMVLAAAAPWYAVAAAAPPLAALGFKDTWGEHDALAVEAAAHTAARTGSTATAAAATTSTMDDRVRRRPKAA